MSAYLPIAGQQRAWLDAQKGHGGIDVAVPSGKLRGVPRPLARSGAAGSASGSNRLPDPKKIAFAVAEPGASFTGTLAGVIPGYLGYPIDCLQTRQVIRLELDSPRAKLAHRCIDILDFPSHLRVRAGLRSGRDEYRRLTRCADVMPGYVFSMGRDFGAWLGLVPTQISTGDRTILGKMLSPMRSKC